MRGSHWRYIMPCWLVVHRYHRFAKASCRHKQGSPNALRRQPPGLRQQTFPNLWYRYLWYTCTVNSKFSNNLTKGTQICEWHKHLFFTFCYMFRPSRHIQVHHSNTTGRYKSWGPSCSIRSASQKMTATRRRSRPLKIPAIHEFVYLVGCIFWCLHTNPNGVVSQKTWLFHQPRYDKIKFGLGLIRPPASNSVPCLSTWRTNWTVPFRPLQRRYNCNC